VTPWAAWVGPRPTAPDLAPNASMRGKEMVLRAGTHSRSERAGVDSHSRLAQADSRNPGHKRPAAMAEAVS
jgi:hypothetical protein